MLEDLVPGGVAIPTLGGGGSSLNIFLYIILFVLIVAGGYLFYILSQYKHTAVIRRVRRGAKLIMIDKFREVRGSNGSIRYVLLRTKKLLPPPTDPGSIEIKTNGKLFTELYMSSDGTLRYAKDTLCDGTEVDNQGNIGGLAPVSDNHRIFYFSELKKADSRRNNGFLSKYAAPLIMGSFFLILLVCAMIFAEDIWRPFSTTSANLASASSELKGAISGLVTIQAMSCGAPDSDAPPDNIGGPPR
jgi:hypothetical protein